MVSLIAKLIIQDGQVEQAISAAKALMTEVAREEGTLFYSLNRDTKEANTLIVMERYRDKAALEAHGVTPHLKLFFDVVGPLLAEAPEITIMDELASIR